MKSKPTLLDVFEALIDRLDKLQKDVDELKSKKIEITLDSKLDFEKLKTSFNRSGDSSKRFG